MAGNYEKNGPKGESPDDFPKEIQWLEASEPAPAPRSVVDVLREEQAKLPPRVIVPSPQAFELGYLETTVEQPSPVDDSQERKRRDRGFKPGIEECS